MKKECPACGGSGQVGFFQGVSRFLITWEECPECYGTGYVDTDPGQAVQTTAKKGDGEDYSRKNKKGE